MSRTFVFLPFFIVGCYANGNWIEKIREISKLYIFPTLLITLLLFYISSPYYPALNILFKGASSYEFVNSNILGIGLRLFQYLIASILVIVAINITPKIQAFAEYGKHTLTIYIFHSVIVYEVFPQIYKRLNYQPSLIELIAICIILLLVLCQMTKHKFFENILNPITYLIKK
ncbi:DUF418 domain-containing protein [Sphingobacterium sp. T2]|uniref:DUF418 domain-containing protein n=1 Tax=Sphingobacterium sp. T2 TaxID=1590596 RepID=UPI00057BB62E|nr:DUF418 domain-containing protein [Sphingobacterium sp. T2]